MNSILDNCSARTASHIEEAGQYADEVAYGPQTVHFRNPLCVTTSGESPMSPVPRPSRLHSKITKLVTKLVTWIYTCNELQCV